MKRSRIEEVVRRAVGLPVDVSNFDQPLPHWGGGYGYLISGSGSVMQPDHSFSHGVPDTDHLWEQMYVRPKPVIIVCGFCKSHNAISNPTCIQCGAPMGYGKER